MIKNFRSQWNGLKPCLALAFALALISAPGAYSSSKKQPTSKIVDEPVAWENLLIKGEPTPIFRFAVAHQHAKSGCIGYLYVSGALLEYDVTAPGSDKDHGFRHMRSDLVEARQWIFMGSDMPELELKFSDGKAYHFFRVKESLITEPSLEPGKMKWEDVRSWEPLFEAVQHFDETAKMAEERQNELHPKPPPTVTLKVEPNTVEKGHAATLTWKSENATKLDLQPGIGPVQASGTRDVSPTESTTYVLTARGPGGSNATTGRLIVNVPPSPPTLIMVDPSVLGSGQTIEARSSSINIRGVAMDDSGIPAVTINGASAAMRPKSAQAAEFSSDPIVLESGDNHFEIAATNAAHVETKVAFNVHFTPPPPKVKPKPIVPPNPKALSKSDILDLLKGDVPSSRVAVLVKEYGIKFVPSEEDLREIRAAGGEDDLMEALNQAVIQAKE